MREAPTAELVPWFAVRVRSNFEKTVSLSLRSKGFEEMVPSYVVRTQWSDRVKQLPRPLFPGYVFCRFDIADRLAVVSTPGVVGIAGYAKKPVPIDQHEIEAVRLIAHTRIPAVPCAFCQVGDHVTVERGPLAGLRGTVLHINDSSRLVVSITLLQRSICVEIDTESVRPDSSTNLVYRVPDTSQISSAEQF